jgi:prevent-host-death family protein
MLVHNRYGVMTGLRSTLASDVRNLGMRHKGSREYRMDTISASDAKNRFRALLDKVALEPVIISRHGRPLAVMMSAVEFDARLSAKAEAQDRSNQHTCPPE